MKKRNIITTIIAILALLAIGVGAYYAYIDEQKTDNTQKANYNFADSDYKKAISSADTALYESDIDNIYYSLSPIKYYKLSADGFTQLKPSGTFSKKIKISDTALPLSIPYIKYNGKIFGVGEWKKSKPAEKDIYTYAFAVIKDMPSGFSSPYSCLLLISTDDDGTSAALRNYSEAIAVNPKGTVGGYVFDQRNRTVESSGKLRTDWDLLTLSQTDNIYDKSIVSLSGRMYSRSADAQTYDLRLTKNSRTSGYASSVSCVWTHYDQSGLYYIKQKNDKWHIICRSVSGGKEKSVASFSGNINTDCIIRGNYALNKNSYTLISLLDGKTYKIGESFKLFYDFGVRNGKAVLIGKEKNKYNQKYKVQKIVVFSLSNSQKSVLYANNIMNENSPLCLSDNYIITQFSSSTNAISFSELQKITDKN